MQKLFDIPVELVASGIRPGINPESSPLWTTAMNVHFIPAGARGMRGFGVPQVDSLFFDSVGGLFDSAAGLFDDGGGGSGDPLVSPAASAIRGLLAYHLSTGAKRLAFATIDKIWKWDGGATADEVQSGLGGLVDEQASIGKEATFVSIQNWGEWFVATNFIDPIKIYKTGPSMANLTGTPPTKAKILSKLGPHMLAFNTDLGGNYVEWCAEDNVEQWDNATDPTAGNLPVRDLENHIQAVCPLGESLCVYTHNEMQIMQYLGGIFQFGVKPQIDDIGAMGLFSVISTGPRNYGLILNGIFETDGFSKRIITDKEFARWIEKNVNFDQKSKIIGWHEAKLSQLRWVVPTGNSKVPNLGIGYCYANGAFSFYDQPISMGISPGTYDYSTVGTQNGKIFWSEASDVIAFDGGPINASLVSKPMDLKAPLAWKTLQQIQLHLKDLVSSDLQLHLGWQEKLSDAVQWYGPYTVVGENYEEFPGNLGFVYLTIKLVAQSSAAQWTLEQIKAHGVGAGKRA